MSSPRKSKKVTRPSTHDTEIVEEIEKLLGRKLTMVFEDEPDKKLALNEAGCKVDKDGFVSDLYLCDTGIEKLDKIFPLIKELDPVLLNLNNNSISDISLLSQLPELIFLNIDSNKISDISPLTQLTMLESLSAGFNPIVDITPLAPLVNLALLFISHAQISDISALKGMTMLSTLVLDENQISDISPLQGIKGIEDVWLGSNQIETLPTWILDWGLDIVWDDNVWDKIPEGNFVRVENNPFKNPPIEVIKKGTRAIRAWFAANR